MAFRELFDCQTLIAEVEKRPGLYDIHLKEYSDRIVKEKLWTEVCEAVITDWSNLSPGKRKERVRQLQRRWKSLRDCFRRELKLKKDRLEDGGTNKRKYIYFDQLSFLETTFNEREATSNYSAAQEDQDEEHEECNAPSNSMNPDIPERPSKKRKTKECPKKGYEEELIDILKEKAKEDCDEDKAFLMSLLPKFKKFNDKQRFEAQMELMKVMRRVQKMPAQGPFTPYHSNVPSTSNFQPYVASPGIPQPIQRHLPAHDDTLMDQQQPGEGQSLTQDHMHLQSYSHNQRSLHHARPGQEFAQFMAILMTLWNLNHG